MYLLSKMVIFHCFVSSFFGGVILMICLVVHNQSRGYPTIKSHHHSPGLETSGNPRHVIVTRNLQLPVPPRVWREFFCSSLNWAMLSDEHSWSYWHDHFPLLNDKQKLEKQGGGLRTSQSKVVSFPLWRFLFFFLKTIWLGSGQVFVF